MALVPCAAPVEARDLPFEDRVRAQKAIEQVYYAHQQGATRPFEEAAPRQALEKKVSNYLRQSAALQEFWRTPVTQEMLERETMRMVRETRFPDRLRELFAALGDDPFLVQECLARPALVDRLARGFFAFDARVHSRARETAESLHADLVRLGAHAFETDTRRSELDLVQVDGADGRVSEGDAGRPTVELSREEYGRWRSRVPGRVGEIGLVQEEREAFVIRVVMDEGERRSRLASFSVSKRSWEDWWGEVSRDLDATSVTAVARSTWRLPLEDLAAAGPCPADDTRENGSLDDLPDPRGSHTAVWTGSVMVVWGGHNGERALDTGGRYDPATDTWTPTSTTGVPTSRFDHTAVWTGSVMVVWGGSAVPSAALNTGGRYDPATDTWTTTSTTAAPTSRLDHTAVWTGSAMVVWGGMSNFSTQYFNSGGRYDPVADAWTPTSTTGAPTGRRNHTAVWSGHAMIVWGGFGGSYVNTGGQYDPTTDRWTMTTGIGAPSARGLHTAEWTGSVMVVWGGGQGNVAPVSTGGRYDPSRDTWTSTSTTGAPAARAGHSVVWTGSVMVVWGGGASGAPLNTGGLYDPQVDTWAPTSTSGAPTSRGGHSAVWTGDLMIVWGGGSNLATGGRYDPGTDSWTPTATTEAPTGRSGHAALWTGNEMVVWGGIGHDYLNTGSRYDPAIDSWTPTAATGAPTGRIGHSAIWTGSVMVV